MVGNLIKLILVSAEGDLLYKISVVKGRDVVVLKGPKPKIFKMS